MNMKDLSFDIWLHLAALEGIERQEIERILEQDFRPQQAYQLRSRLYQLRIAHMKEVHEREIDIEAELRAEREVYRTRPDNERR